jgi:hypothetical protein
MRQDSPFAPKLSSVLARSVKASARSINSRPKPLRAGVDAAPPLSRRFKIKSGVPGMLPFISVSAISSLMSQDIFNRPASSFRAPYLTALVASSCRASPSGWISE